MICVGVDAPEGERDENGNGGNTPFTSASSLIGVTTGIGREMWTLFYFLVLVN